MILVTTEGVPGRTVTGCQGIIAAEAVSALSASQMFALSSEKMVEIREQLLFEGRERVLDRLATVAAERGAHAVVAIRLDYELVEPTYGMLLATATGTAVTLAPEEAKA